MKRPKTKTVAFGQLTTAERLVGEIVAFAHDQYFEVAEINERKKLVTLVRVAAPKDRAV